MPRRDSTDSDRASITSTMDEENIADDEDDLNGFTDIDPDYVSRFKNAQYEDLQQEICRAVRERDNLKDFIELSEEFYKEDETDSQLNAVIQSKITVLQRKERELLFIDFLLKPHMEVIGGTKIKSRKRALSPKSPKGAFSTKPTSSPPSRKMRDHLPIPPCATGMARNYSTYETESQSVTMNVNEQCSNQTTEDSPQSNNYNINLYKKYPIMLRLENDSYKVIKVIQEKYGPGIEARLTGEYFKIVTKDSNQYRDVSNYLTENGHDSYLIQPLAERPIKAVLRGLPSVVDTEEIKTSLIENGFTPIRVVRMLNSRTKEPMPLIMVELKRDNNNDKIFDLKACCGIIVGVEALRYKGPTQCFKCNRFGHISRLCRMTPRCLKCGKDHETRECSLDKCERPMCINCGEVGHTAAWRQCPKFPRNRAQGPSFSSRTVNPTLSYANATKVNFGGVEPTRVQGGNNLQFQIQNQSGSGIGEIAALQEFLKEIRNIFVPLGGIYNALQKIKRENTPIDKLSILIELFSQT